MWKVRKSGSHWVDDAGQEVALGLVLAQLGQWLEVAHGGQSWVRCELGGDGLGDVGGGGGCLQGAVGGEGGDGHCGAAVEGEVAVDG